MIRPFTCISVLLACGSGLYLYQIKHQAQLMDRQIEHTVKAITATQMQTRELAAAWTLLGNPDRLQTLANQYLGIKPVQPSQFVALSDLDSRLPPPRALPPPESATPDDSGAATMPIASASPDAPPDAPSDAPLGAVAEPDLAAPAANPRAVAAAGVAAAASAAASGPSPAPAERSAPSGKAPGAAIAASAPGTDAAKTPAVMASRAADRKPDETARLPHEVTPHEGAQARSAPPRPAAPPVVAELNRADRPTPQRLAPTPQRVAPTALTGSLLGMAHIAVPAPVPLSAAPSPANGN